MPANLPAEAKAKWRKYLEARTPEEKLKALQEFLSAVPKHKGTEKLISQIRHKIAVLRREIEESKKRKRGKGPKLFVEKEGDIQIVIIGFPNSGKSTLLSKITNAKTEASEIPYVTKKPVPGMAVHKDIYIQLVDTPSLSEDPYKFTTIDRQVATLIRNADGVIIVLDALNNPINQFCLLEEKLKNLNILFKKPKGIVKIERKRSGGIMVVGECKNFTRDDAVNLLRSYGIYHAVIKIVGEVTLDDIEKALFESTVYKPAVILVNKSEALSDEDKKEIVRSIGITCPVFFVSCITGDINIGEVFDTLMKLLDVNRIYLKEPGKPPSRRPLVVKGSIKVSELIEKIPSLSNRKVKYAKVWSSRLPFSPQKVGLDFTLCDGDIVEIH